MTPIARVTLTIEAACMLCGLLACKVYDEAALERKATGASSESTVRKGMDGGTHPVTQCRGARCDAGSQVSRDSAPRPALDAGRQDAKARRAVAVVEAGVSHKAMHALESDDAAAAQAGSKAATVDSGHLTEFDASVDAGAAEGGFCSACDSTTPTNPVLDETGGTGNVTSFGSTTSPAPSAGGACNYASTSIFYFAAINVNVEAGDAKGQWQGGRICGQCAAVRVKTRDGWKESVVRVVDKCSDASCGIVLAGAPASDLMGAQPGRYEGEWHFVSCAGHPQTFDGPAAIHVKEGSSQWWALVQVRNADHAVTAIDWQSSDGASSGTFAYATEAENYFSVPEAVLKSNMVRLTLHYRDASVDIVDVVASQLANPEAVIALP